jgi:hypothetical protein
MPYYGSDYSSDHDDDDDEEDYMEEHNQAGSTSRSALNNGPRDYEHDYKGRSFGPTSLMPLLELFIVFVGVGVNQVGGIAIPASTIISSFRKESWRKTVNANRQIWPGRIHFIECMIAGYGDDVLGDDDSDDGGDAWDTTFNTRKVKT